MKRKGLIFVSQSDCVAELNRVILLLKELVHISSRQQELFATKDWGALAETFQRREELVTEACNAWNEFNCSVTEAQEDQQNIIVSLKATARELIEAFLKNDQYVQAFMNYQMESILIELGRRKNLQVVVEQYKKVERMTDVVSRTFKNGSRYFDGDY